jgi:hypothetical protein
MDRSLFDKETTAEEPLHSGKGATKGATAENRSDYGKGAAAEEPLHF